MVQAQKEYAPEFANCKDKFMVQTTVLGETEQIEKDTFNKDVRKDLKEYRLRVTIEGPAAPPSPVPEANEADDEAVARSAAPTAAATSVSEVPSVAGDSTTDVRLRTTLDSLTAATSENQQLKGQVERLQRERDDLRRQLDTIQLSGAKVPVGGAVKPAAKPSSALTLVYVLLAAILSFILGHYVRI